ncbi:MAG: hypothetical protein HW403_1040 [Dehalococcoidia bacterium]|nr:hypothetical protein [Dehalococcoidia bacterium]
MSSEDGDVQGRARPIRLEQRVAGRVLWLAAAVFLAATAEWYLGHKVTLIDGLIFYGAATFCFLRGTNDTATSVGPASFTRRELAILGIILILALGLRLYKLDTIPYGLWFDEASIGLEASRIAKDGTFRPIYSQGTTSPAAFVYLVALAQGVLGQTIVAVRLVPALMGAATVVPFYLLARRLFDPRVALAGACFLAVSRWELNFSRMGMQGITTPFFTLVVAALILAAIESRQSGRSGLRTALWAAAGFTMGMGAWFYSAFLLFPAVVGVYLAGRALADWRFLKQQWLGLAVFVVMAALIASPIGMYALNKPGTFFARMSTASAFPQKGAEERLSVLGSNLKAHLLMFNYMGDRNGRHNLPGEPMVDPVVGVLGVLGAAYALYRWPKPLHLWLLAWLTVMLMGGVLSLPFEAPQGLRSIGALPAVYLLACLALDRLVSGFSRLYSPKIVIGGLVALVALVGYSNLYTYFGRQVADFASWNSFSTPETVVARRISGLLKAGYQVYVSPMYHGHPAIQYLSPNAPYQLFDTANGLPLLATEGRVALFLSPEETVPLDLVKSYYPDVSCEAITSPKPGPPSIFFCDIGPQELKAAHGLTVKYHLGAREQRTEPVLSVEPNLKMVWGSSSHPPPPFRVEWTGSLYVPQYGRYRFMLDGNIPASLHIDNDEITSEGGGVVLAKGIHDFRATAEVSGPGGLSLMWERDGGQREAISAEYFFNDRTPAMGLIGSYYPNVLWDGKPSFQRIDPAVAFYFHLLPLPRPFSVEWRGSIKVAADGMYRFATQSVSSSEVYLDNRLVVNNTANNELAEGIIDLTKGWHEIKVRYQNRDAYSRVYLYWTPPGGSRAVVPPSSLRPW